MIPTTPNPNLLSHLTLAAVITLIFALLARLMRGVTASGAIAGAAVCFLIFAGTGWPGFASLVCVFALAWITTHFGYQRKQTLGTAQISDGRNASQVLANLGVAAICAGWYGFSAHLVLLIAMAAALAEAASDTVSSEVGQATSRSARLITNWRAVPAGTDGGVSLAGTIAGMGAAFIVSVVGFAAGMFSARVIFVPALAGVIGMFADSYMGAWLERRGVLNNDAVNFLGTMVAAGVSVLIFLQLA
jgi:uncharacterized protein (TIGR00297 family)